MMGCYGVTIISGSLLFQIPLPPHHSSAQSKGRGVLVGWSIWGAQVHFSIQRFQDRVS